MLETVRTNDRPILRAALAGLTYFALVFGAGFALGAIRVLILVPRVGETLAILFELPIMLALSWVACRWLIACFDVPAALIARLVMGGVAFAILMFAEVGVPTLALGRSLLDHLEEFRKLPALLGLAGQLAFAGFPLVQMENNPQERD